MFFGNSTAAEENAIRDERIVSRALGAVLSGAPLIAQMRTSGASGQPSQPFGAATGDESGFWLAGMIPGEAPIQP